MTNLDTDTTAGDGADTPSTIIQFALKNGAGDIEVDTALLPNEVYKEVLIQGLKAIAERNMSKLTKEAYPDEGQRKQAIHDRAMENVQAMYDGKIKITGAAKVKKASGAVMTEAMRLARNLIKDAMKANKIKISTVKASEITKAAKAYIETNPGLIATAEANIKAREETPMTLDIKSLIKVDPELVAKEEAKKAKAKADKPLSKAQAGKVAPRAKGTKPGAQANA
jgi:hypothetical protein